MAHQGSCAMADKGALAAMREYYERGEEGDRLDSPQGQLELERTKEIVLRHLPSPPAIVADIGGGPGRYALWLGAPGYHGPVRGLVPAPGEQGRRGAAGHPGSGGTGAA